MDLFKDILRQIREDAAGGSVGGGAIAGCSMPLFASFIKQKQPKISSKITKIKFKHQQIKKNKNLGLKEAFVKGLNEELGQDNIVDKLKALEKKDSTDKNSSTTFGLEDDNGGIVRVSIQTDQAEEFERALQAFLADEEEKQGTGPEIAEILFQLRNQFNIIDVSWPDVEEDEEEGQELEGGEDTNFDAENNIEGNDETSLDGLVADEDQPEDESEAKSVLQQVIDMMKTDAEARKAEAEARMREAEAKAQETEAKVTMSKVKQEEELLDMDDYFKKQQEEKKEIKRLAKLAKWKHEMSKTPEYDGDDEDIDFGISSKSNLRSSSEEEEQGRAVFGKTKVVPHDISNFLLGRIKG